MSSVDNHTGGEWTADDAARRPPAPAYSGVPDRLQTYYRTVSVDLPVYASADDYHDAAADAAVEWYSVDHLHCPPSCPCRRATTPSNRTDLP
ncbi:hypothetical protein L5G32_18935 [Gordonia sp. HY002]|uniref:hypothetical protein n=1 Tax=Gordonia zhenghanii TaxID=2911516 RepID=UPI001EEFBE7E|nr:hypothetical protein [Gordonia zhenghanii]MCF8572335.1 hypothetical protein [Gordonia zhenghanii]MCF8607305.1 hypothetical protein [Gordonia zhenghanii]